MAYLMECGHVSNAEKINTKTSKSKPYCLICDCDIVQKEIHGTEGLEGRMAICDQHKYATNTPIESKWELPFFQYCPDEEYDKYYCGCWGWD